MGLDRKIESRLHRAWIPKAWEPPVADPIIAAEVERAAGLPLGPELRIELGKEDKQAADRSLEEMMPPVLLISGLTWKDVVPPRVTFLSNLTVLTHVVQFHARLQSSYQLKVLASTCTRLSSACHFYRITGQLRRLARLDRALRFRAHPDFLSADVRLEDDVIDLEAASDMLSLSLEDLKALQTCRMPSNSAVEAVKALHVWLLHGRPDHGSLPRTNGEWQNDRRILDPMVLKPLVYTAPEYISQDALRKLRVGLCDFLEHTPGSILARSGTGGTSAPHAEVTAAAIAQWIWAYVATQELDVRVGVLERVLLVQPDIGKRRIDRLRKTLAKQLDELRTDPLHARLLRLGPERLQLQSTPGEMLRRGQPAPTDTRGSLASGSTPSLPGTVPVGDPTRPAKCRADAETSRTASGGKRPRRRLAIKGQAALPALEGPQPRSTGASAVPVFSKVGQSLSDTSTISDIWSSEFSTLMSSVTSSTMAQGARLRRNPTAARGGGTPSDPAVSRRERTLVFERSSTVTMTLRRALKMPQPLSVSEPASGLGVAVTGSLSLSQSTLPDYGIPQTKGGQAAAASAMRPHSSGAPWASDAAEVAAEVAVGAVLRTPGRTTAPCKLSSQRGRPRSAPGDLPWAPFVMSCR